MPSVAMNEFDLGHFDQQAVDEADQPPQAMTITIASGQGTPYSPAG